MQTRTNGSNRKAERSRDLLIGEVGPGEEKQHVALVTRQGAERIGKARLVRPGIIPAHVEPRQGAQPPLLVPVMATERVVGYPEEPRPLLSTQGVVAPTRRERAREGLRREITPKIGARAPREVRVDRVEVPLEQLLKGSCSHTLTFPQRPQKFSGEHSRTLAHAIVP